MNIDKERFKRMFPYLSEEMISEKSRLPIKSVRSDPESGEKAASSTFEGYDPDVIDFLRRCDNEEQAIEVINYMERKGEITSIHAARLRKQLKEKGVRSFGTKKGEDYYLREAGSYKKPLGSGHTNSNER
jgi:hypothetical protein